MQRRQDARLPHWLKLAAFVAAFHPNCTRCCPTGLGGCQCDWAWEDCPPEQSCNGGFEDVSEPFGDAGPRGNSQSISARANDAASDAPSAIAIDRTIDEPVGGTLAFIEADAGTFVVAAISASDKVRIVRVDATRWEEDPLTARTVGEVELASGDTPGRVVADDRGRALVALRNGGAIATIDPMSASVVDRRAVCAAPRGIAFEAKTSTIHVACASGEIVSLRSFDDHETRISVGAELHDIAMFGDSVIANAGAREVVLSNGEASSWRDASNVHADRAWLGDATAIVDDGEAFFASTPNGTFARVGNLGITRAVALANIRAESITRRVLALQTERPRMLVLFTTSNVPTAAAFEPLE